MQFNQKSNSKSAKNTGSSNSTANVCQLPRALENESILRTNLGVSADVPDVPSRTSMVTQTSQSPGVSPMERQVRQVRQVRHRWNKEMEKRYPVKSERK